MKKQNTQNANNPHPPHSVSFLPLPGERVGVRGTENGKTKNSSSLRAQRINLKCLSTAWDYRVTSAPRNDKEAGNALWFILISIVLLGLLTSMLTRSGSSTNETGDYEQLTIQANEILQYAKSIENGVQSLLARGCSENEISFEANNNSGYTNPNSPPDNSCHIFEPEGAGLTHINFSLFRDTHYGAGTRAIQYVGQDNRSDIWLQIRPNNGNIPKVRKICDVINKKFNIPPDDKSTVNYEPELNGYWSGVKFTGQYPIDSTPHSFSVIEGKHTFCHGHNAGLLSFQHVLHAR